MSLKMIRKQHHWVGMSLIALSALVSSCAFALGFEVDKTRFTLSLGSPVDSIRVKNTSGTGPVSLQAQVMTWKQENGQDVYTPSKDLIIAPPIVTIPLGRSQIMRIGWRAPSPLQQELAYRVYLQEITPLSVEKLRIGVQLKLNVGLPIFIRPDNPTFNFNWSARRGPGNAITVTLENRGNVHIQLIKFDLLDGQNRSVGFYQDPFYVLPQQSKTFQVRVQGYSGGALKGVATTDSETLTTMLNVS